MCDRFRGSRVRGCGRSDNRHTAFKQIRFGGVGAGLLAAGDGVAADQGEFRRESWAQLGFGAADPFCFRAASVGNQAVVAAVTPDLGDALGDELNGRADDHQIGAFHAFLDAHAHIGHAAASPGAFQRFGASTNAHDSPGQLALRKSQPDRTADEPHT